MYRIKLMRRSTLVTAESRASESVTSRDMELVLLKSAARDLADSRVRQAEPMSV